ncbi:MAG: hypothetical protein KAJ18_02620 [Candidatus Omnitrophica bacterium]|nr:hypothetical protein [Candidatus Omnitrophota bacterium]
MKSIINDLKTMLTHAIKKEPYDGLLFSGGLDTSVLAAVNPAVKYVSVCLEDKAEDLYYLEILSKFLNVKPVLRKVSVDEAIENIPEVIKILKSFDPAIPNDLAVYFGIKEAKKLGINKIATGDGSDEIFAGYSFMRDIENLTEYIQRISRNMFFSSNVLADSFDLNIRQPFMDKEIVNFALKVPNALKIREDNGDVWGKWILRKAFEDDMPDEITWQSKRPLEYGSGMNYLRDILSDKVSDEEFNNNQYGIKFLNKEHLYYYKIYKNVVGDIPKPKENEKQCPGCGAGMMQKSFHCKICGYVLDWRE